MHRIEKNSKNDFENAFQWSLHPAKDISFAVHSIRIWNLFKKYIYDNKSVIDLGCGAGILLYNIQRLTRYYNNCSVLGYDFSEEAISLARKLCPDAEFKTGDVTSTNFPSNSFDIVTSSMVIEHVDDDGFLTEISRITKPGGVLFLTTVMKKNWAWYYLRNNKGESVLSLTHIREYRSADEVVFKIMKYGFKKVYLETTMLKFSLLDFLLIRLAALLNIKYFLEMAAEDFIVALRKILRIPIPGYYAIELIAVKE